jgi:hypothetical protein
MEFARSTALLSSLYRMDSVCSVSAQVMVITLGVRQPSFLQWCLFTKREHPTKRRQEQLQVNVRAEHITDLTVAHQLFLTRHLPSRKIRGSPEVMPTGTRDNRSGSGFATTENDSLIPRKSESGFRRLRRGKE